MWLTIHVEAAIPLPNQVEVGVCLCHGDEVGSFKQVILVVYYNIASVTEVQHVSASVNPSDVRVQLRSVVHETDEERSGDIAVVVGFQH